MPNYTPLRYPGGKGKFSNFLIDLIKMNDLYYCDYVEPFAGGAGIAFNLLFGEYVNNVHLNDLNKQVYSFWHSVLNNTDGLISLISDTPVDIENWKRLREVKNNADEHSTLEVGFATFFLNRTNRSGIINAGVIGGLTQNGEWKIDARFNKSDLIKRIQKIASYKERINIYNLDASVFLNDTVSEIKNTALVYLDPPYYVKGQGLYENSFSHEDHALIASHVKKISKHWLVSYDAEPQILELYKDYRSEIFRLSYSANKHTSGAEVMFFKDGLNIPKLPAIAKAI